MLTIVFVILIISSMIERLLGIDLLSDFAVLLLYIFALHSDVEDRIQSLEHDFYE
jgi:hypothetical protein